MTPGEVSADGKYLTGFNDLASHRHRMPGYAGYLTNTTINGLIGSIHTILNRPHT